MPTYEYRCDKCGRFELEQRITEDPLKTCPHCGGQVERLISANVNFILKGPGFYATDNRPKEPSTDSDTKAS
ncbi:MAG: FmdB family zinc ribbon protein [Limnochordia bacterium]